MRSNIMSEMNGEAKQDVRSNGHATLKHEPSSLISESTIDIPVESSQPAKRKFEDENGDAEHQDKRRKGTAPVKEEYLIPNDPATEPLQHEKENRDDDAAEAFHHRDRSAQKGSNNQRKKQKGQNKGRQLKASSDEAQLCSTRSHAPEFSPKQCPFNDKCKFEHDLRKYLNEGKRSDLAAFDGICPVWKERGKCRVGWSCRFVRSHSKEIEHADGRKELVLVEDPDLIARYQDNTTSESSEIAVVNNLSPDDRHQLTRKKYPTPKSDVYLPYLDRTQQDPSSQGKHGQKRGQQRIRANSSSPEPDVDDSAKRDNNSQYVDPPLLPSEKRRLYFGPDTPVLAPLTTQGNLPFRRLCTSLGASFTYSEMAMSMPLLSGQRSEWALLKAHESEIQPPTFLSNDLISSIKAKRNPTNIVYDYKHPADLSFGAQISANKPWLAVKTTEVLSTLLPKGLRVIDLNCGCPIDLVFKEGAGSALLDSPNKLDKMLRGMNTVSGEIPVSVKIRMGTRTGQPTAQKLVERLVLGVRRDQWSGHRETPCGVAAITLHGRSRQQRYTREADWDYISQTAALVQSLNETADADADTIRQVDERDQPAGVAGRRHGTFFIGNGDAYSHVDYYNHLEQTGVDGVMLARGALIKPWIFEEIAQNQYLDKSAAERVGYIERFVRYALEAWGTDTHGISTARRFLLEYLSFAHRYVPLGLLEHLPPKINERPPRYRGRNELETLLASDSYKDWIKISEMFLGPVKEAEGKDVNEYGWVPKHKSNAWEAEAQG